MRDEQRGSSGRATGALSRRQMLSGLAGGALTAGARAAPARAQSSPRPNVILIVADDLRADDLAAMPIVRSLIVEQGVDFAHCFATAPGCGPSRASVLRGQYPHNHGVLRSGGKWGGFDRFHALGNESSTLATWLHDAGYRTALIGKYLNEYPTSVAATYVPPGWDEWIGATKEGYFGFELNENGRLVRYRRRDREFYSTDVLAAKASDFIARAAAANEPFFLLLTPRAPHGPAEPAPRHAGSFATATAPRPPSFDEPDVSDKPAWVQATPALEAAQVAEIDALYRDRLETLQSLDESVEQVVATLRTSAALDQTYLIFTSDNGFHLGEHRVISGKGTPYEEAIRMPLVLRGPGVPVDRTIRSMVSLTDLAPTIAAWAGADVPAFVDGRSLVPLLSEEPPPPRWRRAVLVEHHANRPERTDGQPAFRALRADDLVYVEYADGGRELYDLNVDPHQLENQAATTDPAVIQALSAQVLTLATCSGDSCRAAEGAAPAP